MKPKVREKRWEMDSSWYEIRYKITCIKLIGAQEGSRRKIKTKKNCWERAEKHFLLYMKKIWNLCSCKCNYFVQQILSRFSLACANELWSYEFLWERGGWHGLLSVSSIRFNMKRITLSKNRYFICFLCLIFTLTQRIFAF